MSENKNKEYKSAQSQKANKKERIFPKIKHIKEIQHQFKAYPKAEVKSFRFKTISQMKKQFLEEIEILKICISAKKSILEGIQKKYELIGKDKECLELFKKKIQQEWEMLELLIQEKAERQYKLIDKICKERESEKNHKYYQSSLQYQKNISDQYDIEINELLKDLKSMEVYENKQKEEKAIYDKNMQEYEQEQTKAKTIYGKNMQEYEQEQIKTKTIYDKNMQEYEQEQMKTKTIYNKQVNEYEQEQMKTKTIYGKQVKEYGQLQMQLKISFRDKKKQIQEMLLKISEQNFRILQEIMTKYSNSNITMKKFYEIEIQKIQENIKKATKQRDEEVQISNKEMAANIIAIEKKKREAKELKDNELQTIERKKREAKERKDNELQKIQQEQNFRAQEIKQKISKLKIEKQNKISSSAASIKTSRSNLYNIRLNYLNLQTQPTQNLDNIQLELVGNLNQIDSRYEKQIENARAQISKVFQEKQEAFHKNVDELKKSFDVFQKAMKDRASFKNKLEEVQKKLATAGVLQEEESI